MPAESGQPPNDIPLRVEVPNLRQLTVPSAIASHPLVAKRYFYTIPERLLDRVLREPFRPLNISYDQIKDLGWGKSEQDLAAFVQTANPRLTVLSEATRGYCGWLMMSRTFVEQHDELLRKYRDHITAHDFPKPLLAKAGPVMPQSPSDEPWVSAFREFYSQWRLQSLVGPSLPMPLPTLLPSFPALSETLSGAAGGTTLFIPDVMPLSSRGVVPDAIEDAVHGQQPPDHLAEWLRIVKRDNAAKNVISRYARLFRLQHYWRILHTRHSNAVDRNKGRLIEAFADFLDVSSDSIHKDLLFVGRRLGKGWERRDDSLV